eukprot:scaffold41876_cov60-Phaeocystis_antarctica.AAC.1
MTSADKADTSEACESVPDSPSDSSPARVTRARGPMATLPENEIYSTLLVFFGVANTPPSLRVSHAILKFTYTLTISRSFNPPCLRGESSRCAAVATASIAATVAATVAAATVAAATVAAAT